MEGLLQKKVNTRRYNIDGERCFIVVIVGSIFLLVVVFLHARMLFHSSSRTFKRVIGSYTIVTGFAL
jgi:hypothetical protein